MSAIGGGGGGGLPYRMGDEELSYTFAGLRVDAKDIAGHGIQFHGIDRISSVYGDLVQCYTSSWQHSTRLSA